MRKLVLCLLAVVSPAIQAQVEDLPPAYPRDGAHKILENEHVIVWDISWLQQDYPKHRHRYDHTGVYYSTGDRLIISNEGESRAVHTEAWNISFQLAGVTHTEIGTSDAPLRAVFVQIKRPVATTSGSELSLPQFPTDSPLERLSNERVKVWEYTPAASGADNAQDSVHYHGHDAVVVWFDADTRPNVHFVSRGSTHAADIPTAASRVFVFEIL